MSLPRNVYEELEAVVGKEYISDKEYILAGNRAPRPGGVKVGKPAAILLPATTEEIQQIVKICNKYDIPYIAVALGCFITAYPNPKSENTIVLCLKRMDKIVEINEEDRYVVIEPGVRHAHLRPELIKHDLSYTVASVGPGGSVLANFSSVSGDNHNEHAASHANRYLLGVEWVLPTGEIVRTGSLATDGGWFCPDGPGPSLRGVVKGFCGHKGNMGIITKIAIGLDKYHGDPHMEVEGHGGFMKTRVSQDCSRVLVYKFDDLDGMRDAMLEIGKAEVGVTVIKQFYLPLALMMTHSANEWDELWNDGEFQDEMGKALIVYLAPWTPEELAYEEKVVLDIFEETGGVPVKEKYKNWFDDHMEFFVICTFLQRVLRLGGGWAGFKQAQDSLHHMFEIASYIPDQFEGFTGPGKIINSPYSFQIIPMEYGHLAHIELLYEWDLTMPGVMQYVREFRRRSSESDREHGLHSEMPGGSISQLNSMGPLYSNFHIWAMQMKETFDPNNVANPMP